MTAEEFDWSEIEILILDDNAPFRNLVADVLRGSGVRNIHMAGDAGDAFNTLKTSLVDIALVDFIMDPLDGAEFTRMVRTGSDSSNPELPIIIVTGDATAKTLDTVLKSGAHDFLVKPISAEALMARLHRTLTTPRQFVRDGSFYGPAPLAGDQPNKRKPARTLGIKPRSITPSI
ncbi:MAG: response regulator [Rhodospirillaceae bacterium]|nr:response regulator [Rhodospirillaceae bacterium]